MAEKPNCKLRFALLGVVAVLAVVPVFLLKSNEPTVLPERPPTLEEIMKLAADEAITNDLVDSYINSVAATEGTSKIMNLAEAGDIAAAAIACGILWSETGSVSDKALSHHYCEIAIAAGVTASKANLIYRNFNSDPGNMNWQETYDAFAALKKEDPAIAHRGLQFLYRQDHPRASGTLMRIHLKEAIRHGSTNAMVALAEFDLYGIDAYGRPYQRNPQRAEKLLKRAYANNDFLGGYKLALLYRDGKKLEQDTQSYIDIITRLSAFEYPAALGELAYMYDSGRGQIQDRRRAMQLHMRAAELGNIFSMTTVGPYLIEDPVWEEKGVEFLEKSAASGEVQSMTRLAGYYRRPETVAPEGRIMELQIAAALRGDLQSHEALFWGYMDEGYIEAMEPYIQALEFGHKAGDPEASYYLARQYRAASGVERDLLKAKGLLEGVDHLKDERIDLEVLIIGDFINHYGVASASSISSP